MKELHRETYKGFEIWVNGKFIKDDYVWNEGFTDVVRLEYGVWDSNGHPVNVDSFGHAVVSKKKPYRILFWTKKPKLTFEEEVESTLLGTVDYIKEKIDKRIYEKEMTDGLLDSLKKVK